MFMTVCFIERKLPKGGAGGIWTWELLYTLKTQVPLLGSTFNNCNFKHYLSSHVLCPTCKPNRVGRSLSCSHCVSCTEHSEGQTAAAQTHTGWVNEGKVPFVVRKQSSSRVDASMASLGTGTCCPFLARATGSFHFRFCLPWASANIPSFSNLVHHRSPLTWLGLSGSHHAFLQHFPSDANISFPALPSVACLGRRPRSGLPCFELFFICLIF